jgi:hypothetical protein
MGNFTYMAIGEFPNQVKLTKATPLERRMRKIPI